MCYQQSKFKFINNKSEFLQITKLSKKTIIGVLVEGTSVDSMIIKVQVWWIQEWFILFDRNLILPMHKTGRF